MSNYLNKRDQQGVALLSALLIVTIFAIMGMMNAKKAKESEKIAGAVVRYNTVFEAAEQSLRDAGDYLLRIRGTPYVGDGSKGAEFAESFDISTLDTVSLVMDPNKAIVWNRDMLSVSACGVGGCAAGVDFVNRLDSGLWNNLAVKTDFGGACGGSSAATDEVACNNYLRDIETYTVIQQLRTKSGAGGGVGGPSAMPGTMGLTGAGYETYYLITVKGSGFPPGTTAAQKSNPLNSRENVILQGVFARL